MLQVCFKCCHHASSVLQVLSPCFKCCHHASSVVTMLQVLSPCFKCCHHVSSVVTMLQVCFMLQVLSPCFKCASSVVTMFQVCFKCCHHDSSVVTMLQVLSCVCRCAVTMRTLPRGRSYRGVLHCKGFTSTYGLPITYPNMELLINKMHQMGSDHQPRDLYVLGQIQ